MTAGIARDSVHGAMELIEYAAGLGYDAALVRVPYWRWGGRRL